MLFYYSFVNILHYILLNINDFRHQFSSIISYINLSHFRSFCFQKVDGGIFILKGQKILNKSISGNQLSELEFRRDYKRLKDDS